MKKALFLMLVCTACFAADDWNPGTKVSANQVLAGPTSGAAGAVVPRAIVLDDIPSVVATVRTPVKAAVTGAVTVSNPGTNTFDSYVASVGDRLLLTAQASPSQNGIWLFQGSASAMTRPADYSSGSTTEAYYGLMVQVTNGANNQYTWWYISTTGAITIDTTSVTWTIYGINITQAIAPAGNSGGVPFYATTGSLQSSALLTNHGVLVGGGSGAGPAALAVASTGTMMQGVSSANPSFSATPTLGNATTSGSMTLAGKTSGSMIYSTPDATGQNLTVTATAQTGGAATISIPNLAGTSGTFVTGPSAGPVLIAGPTAARTVTFPDAAFTAARTDAGQTFTGSSTATSWTFVTPALGTPASGTLTNCTGLPPGGGGNNHSRCTSNTGVTTLAQPTGMSVTVTASKNYVVDAWVVATNTTTGGLQCSINATSPTSVAYLAEFYQLTSNTFIGASTTTTNNTGLTSGAGTSGDSMICHIHGTVVGGASTTAIAINAGQASAAGTTTVQSGLSYMTVTLCGN